MKCCFTTYNTGALRAYAKRLRRRGLDQAAVPKRVMRTLLWLAAGRKARAPSRWPDIHEATMLAGKRDLVGLSVDHLEEILEAAEAEIERGKNATAS